MSHESDQSRTEEKAELVHQALAGNPEKLIDELSSMTGFLRTFSNDAKLDQDHRLSMICTMFADTLDVLKAYFFMSLSQQQGTADENTDE